MNSESLKLKFHTNTNQSTADNMDKLTELVNSKEEVVKLKREISYYCRNKDCQYRNMPSYMSIQFCFKISLFDG